jgi:hypothetical protein
VGPGEARIEQPDVGVVARARPHHLRAQSLAHGSAERVVGIEHDGAVGGNLFEERTLLAGDSLDRSVRDHVVVREHGQDSHVRIDEAGQPAHLSWLIADPHFDDGKPIVLPDAHQRLGDAVKAVGGLRRLRRRAFRRERRCDQIFRRGLAEGARDRDERHGTAAPDVAADRRSRQGAAHCPANGLRDRTDDARTQREPTDRPDEEG